jgi:hypothetical protein
MSSSRVAAARLEVDLLLKLRVFTLSSSTLLIEMCRVVFSSRDFENQSANLFAVAACSLKFLTGDFKSPLPLHLFITTAPSNDTVSFVLPRSRSDA